MTFSSKMLTLGLILAAGVAVAKEGVQNPVVKERMDLMGVVRVNTGILGDMAQGKADFDADKAAEAAAALAAAAAEIPQAFEANETDPVTEAKPEIWTDFETFTARSDALFKAAQGIDTSSLDALRVGMGAVAGACKDCHTDFRIQTN